MRSIIATALVFSSLSLGTITCAQAQEVPEYQTVAQRIQGGRAVWSRGYLNQDANRLYINRDPNCTVWGHKIYPCE